MNLIYIRVDANSEIGMGHLVRCFALAQMLSESFGIVFLYKELPEKIIADLQFSGFQTINISVNNDCNIEFIPSNSVVILDGYSFQREYFRKIRGQDNIIIFIDDLNAGFIDADLIINAIPGFCANDYKSPPFCIHAIGINYALLRKEFVNIKSCVPKKEPDSIVICFGGADPLNLTLKVLQEVQKFDWFKKIHVIVGVAYKANESLPNFISLDSRIVFYQNLSALEMATILCHVQYAIVPASGILLEALACKCKVLSGAYINNQRKVIEFFTRQKTVLDVHDFSAPYIKNGINNLLSCSLSEEEIIDGKSNQRIKRIIMQIIQFSTMRFRSVEMSDAKLLFEWATDSSIRRYSLSQTSIEWADHVEWLKNKLGDENCFFFIVEYEDNPIGVLRFDIHNQSALISYSLDPKYHGKGMGGIMLAKGIKQLLKISTKEISRFQGVVIKENLASIRIFEKLGFDKTSNSDTVEFTKINYYGEEL